MCLLVIAIHFSDFGASILPVNHFLSHHWIWIWSLLLNCTVINFGSTSKISTNGSKKIVDFYLSANYLPWIILNSHQKTIVKQFLFLSITNHCLSDRHIHEAHRAPKMFICPQNIDQRSKSATIMLINH